MTHVNERVLIVAGHAWQCPACRRKLQADREGVLIRQGLTSEERELLGQLAPDDWATIGSLAQALGVARCELEKAMNHPRCRLRHL